MYGLPSHPGTWHRQLWVATLAHPGSAVGLESAAAYKGYEGFGQHPVQLVVPPGANVRSKVATLHRYAGAKITRLDGLPVTTDAQTLADLCGRPSAPRVEPAMDRLLLTGKLLVPELVERRRFYEGSRRNGNGFFSALVDERSDEAWTPTDGALGDLLRPLVRRVGEPAVWEAPLPWEPESGRRVDVLFPARGVILEGDGRSWHARVKDFDADRWRDNVAAAHGLVVVRFTWVHLTHRFEACVDVARDVLASRPRRAA